MHVDLSQEDVEMIVDSLNVMADNIRKQREEPEYQPYMLDDRGNDLVFENFYIN